MRRLGVASVLLLISVVVSLEALAQEGVPSPSQALAPQTVQAAPSTAAVFTGQVDHAASGCGLRNFDSCTIRLRGIPSNSTVVRAFLYWAMICAGTSCPTSVDIEFDGRTITSSLIRTAPQP